MDVRLIGRALGRQEFVVSDGPREYRATYDVRRDWWRVTGRGGELREFGAPYNRVVKACEPHAEKAG
jgi:hypothetical protein